MVITGREFWVVFHGLLLGSFYLLAFAGGAAGLWSLRPSLVTEQGISERLRRLKVGVWTMSVTSWLTVISGTYLVYTWYREKVPESPRSMLLADPTKAAWHTFGMEWKEHVAWIAPILTTSVGYLVNRYGRELLERQEIRRAAFLILAIAFASAAVAGLFGAFINKAAPLL